MGCDIHFYVERRVNGQWETADTWYEDADEPGVKSTYLWGPGLKKMGAPFYDGRNYDLFAILANVRNGRGFAGLKTGEGFVPIAEPKGVPEDACPEYLAVVERWDGDGHSHSYLTLAELLAYDWTQTTTKQGWVDPVEWAVWRDRGAPESWSGGVGGGGVTHHTPEDFEAAWQKLRAERGYPEQRNASVHLNTYRDVDLADRRRFDEILVPDALEADRRSPYCMVTWEIAYYDHCTQFLAKTLPRLLRLGAPEDVRITFFFDN